MVKEIWGNLSNVNLAKENGRFLSDKSYGFDTVFFLSKFILCFQHNNAFSRTKLRGKAILYVEDLFNLKSGTPGAVNYFIETLNLLEFGNVIEKTSKYEYKIVRLDILEYISECPENAYIFLYLLTYKTYQNDGILKLFEQYIETQPIAEKEIIAMSIAQKFAKKSLSIGDKNSNWAKQLVKYSLTVLGFANNAKYIARTLKLHDRQLTVKDLALNVEGTKTPADMKKKNDYIDLFSADYVRDELKFFLVADANANECEKEVKQSVASGLADIKLQILCDENFKPHNFEYDEEQFEIVRGEMRRRNPTVQYRFKSDLLKNLTPKCQVCNFKFKEFLIAGHIKPYTICDNTYDAINHNNGLLLCPNHDRLFEGAKHMTIKANSGEIVLSNSAKNSADFKSLVGNYVNPSLISDERKHYLQWHNKQFEKINET